MYGIMWAHLRLLAVLGSAHAVLHASLGVNRGPSKAANGAELQAMPRSSRQIDEELGACAPLRSVHGSMYTVSVQVGTPAQELDIVVDTGSNLLIVESCQCKDLGKCATFNKCFTETSSSSLSVLQGIKGPLMAVLNFGSGTIVTEVASDEVQIGNMHIHMDRGVLLMVDNALDFSAPFEGIMGLGLPNSKDSPLALRVSQRKSFFDKSEHDESPFPPMVRMEIDHSEGLLTPVSGLPKVMDNLSPGKFWHGEKDSEPNEVGLDATWNSSLGAGFLRQTNISRFSLCFTESTGEGPDADGGILRFDPPEGLRPLRSIGTMHWGLDFQGISVGDQSEKLDFCSPADMKPDQKTACGAIPDSGTTYIMGPQEQINHLLEALCDQWPRCRSNHTKMSAAADAGTSLVSVMEYKRKHKEIRPMSKVDTLNMLVQDCNSWMEEPLGVNEMPPIHFHVADDTGRSEVLTLGPTMYTITIREAEKRHVNMNIEGMGTVHLGWKQTDRMIEMCKAALGNVHYPTAHNGPTWIIGMPLFHQYTVGFNVAAEPPTLSFTAGPCTGCSSDGATLLKTVSAAPRPRKILGKPRLPTYDTTIPF